MGRNNPPKRARTPFLPIEVLSESQEAPETSPGTWTHLDTDFPGEEPTREPGGTEGLPEEIDSPDIEPEPPEDSAPQQEKENNNKEQLINPLAVKEAQAALRVQIRAGRLLLDHTLKTRFMVNTGHKKKIKSRSNKNGKHSEYTIDILRPKRPEEMSAQDIASLIVAIQESTAMVMSAKAVIASFHQQEGLGVTRIKNLPKSSKTKSLLEQIRELDKTDNEIVPRKNKAPDPKSPRKKP